MVARSPLRGLSLAVPVLAAFIAVACCGSGPGAQAGGSVVAETSAAGTHPSCTGKPLQFTSIASLTGPLSVPSLTTEGKNATKAAPQSGQQPMCTRATDCRRPVRRQVRSERGAAVRSRGEEQRLPRALRLERDVHQRDQCRPTARRLHGRRNRLRPHQSQVVLPRRPGLYPPSSAGLGGRRRVAQARRTSWWSSTPAPPRKRSPPMRRRWPWASV